MPKTNVSKAKLNSKTKGNPTQLLVLIAILVVVGVVVKFLSHASGTPPKLSIDVFGLPQGTAIPMSADSSLGTCGKSFSVISQGLTATYDNDVLTPTGNGTLIGAAYAGMENCLSESFASIGGTLIHFPQTITANGRIYTATYSCSGKELLLPNGGLGGCGQPTDGTGYITTINSGEVGNFWVQYQ